jgi:hypothetical protein
MSKIVMLPAALLLLGLAACNPYNPADRALGRVIGAVTGAATTPPPPYSRRQPRDEA